MYIGFLETYHYNFISTGYTKKACRDNMRKAWAIHCEQSGMPDNWDAFTDCYHFLEVTVGQAFRDGSVIKEA